MTVLLASLGAVSALLLPFIGYRLGRYVEAERYIQARLTLKDLMHGRNQDRRRVKAIEADIRQALDQIALKDEVTASLRSALGKCADRRRDETPPPRR